MKKSLVIGFIFLLLIVGIVNAETYTSENPKVLDSVTSNIPVPELTDNSPPYSFSDNFFQGLLTIDGLCFIIIFLSCTPWIFKVFTVPSNSDHVISLFQSETTIPKRIFLALGTFSGL